MTDEPQRYTLVVRHAEGSWAPGLQTLEPHQSTVLDLAALQAEQVPDAKGRTIPTTVASGQVHWSIGSGRDPRGIVGRIEQVDLALGVSATYACPEATNDIFVDAWIDPGYDLIEVDDIVPFEVWELDEDAWGGGPGDPYEITDILDWDTGNSSIADIVGYGLVKGIANGSTYVHAEGYSNGWLEYDPGEEDPENHEWISWLYADVDVYYAVPTGESTASVGWNASYSTVHDFRQTLQGGNFVGRVVHEEDGGNGNDTCWFVDSQFAKFEAVTGGQWTVDANNKWGLDSVGWFPNSVTYYRNQQRAPCGTQFDQKMYINRPGTSDAHYVTNLLRMGLTATTVWSERAGVYQSKIWP